MNRQTHERLEVNFGFKGNFNEMYARLIFCEAYKLEMFGRKYQWLIMGTYSDEWWKDVDAETNCTIENIEEALQQTILTDLLPLSTSGDITIARIVNILQLTPIFIYFD